MLGFENVLEVSHDVHEIDVRVVRRIVMAEILVHVTVRPVFCAHIVKVV